MSLHVKYKQTIQKLHNYLCQQHPQHKLQIHHSHIDINKLFLYRVIAFSYLTLVYLWTLVDMSSITINFIYLTLQGYFITWLFYALVLQDYVFNKVYGKENPVCKKLKHYVEIAYETAFCFQFPITLVFWTFLFKILIDAGASCIYFSQHHLVWQLLLNTNLHAGPIICLSIEMYYNTLRFPKRHLWVLITFGSVYMLINLIYSISVAIIYKPIDWKSLLSYILVFMSIALVVGAHYFGQFAHKKWKAPKLKDRINEGLIQQSNGQIQDNNNSQQQKQQNSETTGTNPYRMTKQEDQRQESNDESRPNNGE